MNHYDSAFNRHPNPARGCAESVNWNLKGASITTYSRHVPLPINRHYQKRWPIMGPLWYESITSSCRHAHKSSANYWVYNHPKSMQSIIQKTRDDSVRFTPPMGPSRRDGESPINSLHGDSPTACSGECLSGPDRAGDA
jgi:hypothetical protein